MHRLLSWHKDYHRYDYKAIHQTQQSSGSRFGLYWPFAVPASPKVHPAAPAVGFQCGMPGNSRREICGRWSNARHQGKKLTLLKIKGKPFYSAACLFIDAERPQGVWGTPQKCACGWPHAMLAKHVPAQSGDNQTRHPYKFTYAPEWISLDSSKNLDSKSESALIHSHG